MSGKILKTGCLAAELAKSPNKEAVAAVFVGCDAQPLSPGDALASCADLATAVAGAAIADATDTVKGKVALNAGTNLPADATNCTDALTACGLNALLADTTAGGNAVINAIKALDIDVTVPTATDTVAGISALNLGTSLPGDATNATDALTATGMTALLADPSGTNAIQAAIKALDIDVVVPVTNKTTIGTVDLTDLQQMGDGRKVFDAGVHVGSGNPAHAGRATVTAIGPNAGANNTGANQTATGREAGLNNTGANQTATGNAAGYNNTGYIQTATGREAGLNNTGANASFFGANAGSSLGANLGTFTLTPSSSTAGAISPAVPAGLVGTSRAMYINSYDWRVLTFTSTTAYTTTGGPASGTWTGTLYGGLNFDNVTVLGANAAPTASNQVTLGDGAVTEVRTAATYFGAGFTTTSDATLKENIQPINAANALALRNGLKQKAYELFAESQVEIMEEVTQEVPIFENGEATDKTETKTSKVPTGRYKVERRSIGFRYGYIAQDVQALIEQIGDFHSVVQVVGEYFTLDGVGFPAKDKDGKVIVNKRLGLDYAAIDIIMQAAEQYDSSVSMRQARLALLKFGLMDKVEAAVAGADKAIQIDWEFAQSVNRNYGSVTTLAKEMGITDKQLDELFALARTL